MHSPPPSLTLPVVEPPLRAAAPTRSSNGQAPVDGEPLRLEVIGMHCASCVGRVESALLAVPGVEQVRVNLTTGEAVAWRDAAQTNDEALVDALQRIGYSAKLAGDEPLDRHRYHHRQRASRAEWRNRVIVAGVFLAVICLLMYGHLLPGGAWLHALSPWWQCAVAAMALVTVGRPFYQGALGRLRHGSANMDSLVALGTSAAFVAGIWETAAAGHTMYFMDGAMILVFLSIGRYLESVSKGRASDAIVGLLDLSPPRATVLRDGREIEFPVEQIAAGETLLVRPGERIALDASVLGGTSAVDQSWLTGEPLPVDKAVGDALFAGTINGAGALTARVAKTAGQSTLARVVELVRRAQESKTDIQQFADRVVARFVPAILAIALATAAVWTIVGNWQQGVSSAVAVLVVACPCAMGLATPMAVLVASGAAARQGMLVRNAQALETAAAIDVVVFDKTGTLTLGQPHVTEIAPAAGVTEAELLQTAAAAERLSEHPLAAAVVAAAESRSLPIDRAGSLQTVPGGGVVAQLAGGEVRVGNARLMQAAGVDTSAVEKTISAAASHGQTTLLVARDRCLLGALVVADTIRPESKQVIDALHRLGLKTRLLSGDQQATAAAVAAELGIDEVSAGVLPEGKRDAIAALQRAGRRVAMVGDGINDSPALATADVGIAMGAGADIAIEAADVVLMGHDLRGVVRTIELSRATMRAIRQNLFWAFGYNLLLVPLAAGVLIGPLGIAIPPVAAAAAMALSDVSVVGNSLRLRRFG